MKLFVYPPLFAILLASAAPAQWSRAIDPAPTLAPMDCPCKDCKCKVCECNKEPAKPLVSVKKRHTPTEASVKVRSTKADGRSYPYSGTAICQHTVITCAHGLGNEFDKVTIDGKPARVLHIMRDLDVALIQTEHDLKPVSVAKSWPAKGESIRCYGYGMYDEGKLTSIASKSLGSEINGCLRTKESVVPGYSGGGVFNVAGELVGVCRGFDCDTRTGAKLGTSTYSGLDIVRKIIGEPCEFNTVKKTAPKFQSVIDPLKFASPDFSVAPNSACASGNCPLIKKNTPAPLSPVKTGDAHLGQVFSNCPSGQCSKAPAKVVPAPVRRSGFLRRTR